LTAPSDTSRNTAHAHVPDNENVIHFSNSYRRIIKLSRGSRMRGAVYETLSSSKVHRSRSQGRRIY